MNDIPAVHRRRRKMLSVADAVFAMMRESINTGSPLLNSSRFQSMLLHFEADRVRLHGMLFGDPDNDDAVSQAQEKLCPDGRHDWTIDRICRRCTHKELPK
jgi:hypothetical protein